MVGGQTVQIPVRHISNGAAISALIFSLDYDERFLSFDGTDANLDRIPDAVSLKLPAGFNASVTYNANDAAGELDIFLADVFPPLAALADGSVLTVTLRTATVFAITTAAVAFAQNPAPSFGNTAGASVEGIVIDGSV